MSRRLATRRRLTSPRPSSNVPGNVPIPLDLAHRGDRVYPDDLSYTTEHEWLRRPGEHDGSVRVGITHYAQDQLGDIVYVSLPELRGSAAGGSPPGARSARPAASWSRPSRSATSTPRSPARSSPATRRSTRPRSWSTTTRTAAGGCSRSSPASPRSSTG